MMRKITTIFLLVGMLTSCSTTRHSAPVVDRVAVSKVESSKSTVLTQPVPDKYGYYTVKKGDTVLRIALDHGQHYRDIVTWNELTNPNDIKVDQVLRVIPPESSAVVVGPSIRTSSVAIEVKPLPSIERNLPRKTEPRGEKYPYSEAAWVGLQKPEPIVSTLKEENQPDVAGSESISWMWPTEGKVMLGFDGDKNKGVDISGKLGQAVVAAGSGKVMYAGSGIRGYGNLVIVKHTNDLLSAYAHNRTILVKEGQNVAKGQNIAEMGNSDADTIKVHFEIRRQGKPVDPLKFLPAR